MRLIVIILFFSGFLFSNEYIQETFINKFTFYDKNKTIENQVKIQLQIEQENTIRFTPYHSKNNSFTCIFVSTFPFEQLEVETLKANNQTVYYLYDNNITRTPICVYLVDERDNEFLKFKSIDKNYYLENKVIQQEALEQIIIAGEDVNISIEDNAPTLEQLLKNLYDTHLKTNKKLEDLLNIEKQLNDLNIINIDYEAIKNAIKSNTVKEHSIEQIINLINIKKGK